MAATTAPLVGGVTFAAGQGGPGLQLQRRHQVDGRRRATAWTSPARSRWRPGQSLHPGLHNGFGAVIAKGQRREPELRPLRDGPTAASTCPTSPTGGANVTAWTTPARRRSPSGSSATSPRSSTPDGRRHADLPQRATGGRPAATAGWWPNAAPADHRPGPMAYGFKGLIDEPAVYNRALRPARSSRSSTRASSQSRSRWPMCAPTPALSGFTTGLATAAAHLQALRHRPVDGRSGRRLHLQHQLG